MIESQKEYDQIILALAHLCVAIDVEDPKQWTWEVRLSVPSLDDAEKYSGSYKRGIFDSDPPNDVSTRKQNELDSAIDYDICFAIDRITK